MGQKVHPKSFRLVVTKDWDSRWFAKKGHRLFLQEDFKIRKFIKETLSFAGVGKIVLEKTDKKLRVDIHTARPGVVIGKKGSDIDHLRDELQKMTDKQIFINIQEINKPELDPQLVAEGIALQLKKRIPFRRAMKRAISQTMQRGADGIKILCSGRLGGVEIARREGVKEGKIPLHTLTANVQYGFTESQTTYGIIGVKVWIYQEGEEEKKEEKKREKIEGRRETKKQV